MKSLEECRIEIDRIDREMLRLFEERMDVAKDVAIYKKAHNLELFHPEREREVIAKCKDYVKNPRYKKYVEEYMNKLMDISKQVQNEIL